MNAPKCWEPTAGEAVPSSGGIGLKGKTCFMNFSLHAFDLDPDSPVLVIGLRREMAW
jgi:hypothetical protein